MAITVYWSCLEDDWIRAEEPEKVSKRFYEKKIKDDDYRTPLAVNHCPSFNGLLKNLYAVKSLYNYSFTIENNSCVSEMYNQKFFDDHVLVRSMEKKFFSYFNKYIFFTDEKSLEMTAYEHPIFEENAITERCMILPGKYDIGKWFRNLELSFILKKDFNTFSVKNQDVMYYLRFHTKENINFKQFIMTDKLQKMINSNLLANSQSKLGSLDSFYNIFKGKKYILKEIKENLL